MGGRFEASWGLVFGPLGAFFWASRGCGARWGPLGGPGGLSPVPQLGPVLGLSRGPLGPSWAPLGPFGGPLGPSWGGIGASWGGLGGLLGRLGALEARKREKAKNIVKTMKINYFGLLGPSRDASLSSL